MAKVVNLNGMTIKVIDSQEKDAFLTQNDKNMDIRATAAVRAALNKAKICGKPIARYDNSGKQYLEQPRILSEVMHCCRHNKDIRRMIKGFMVESYLEDGSQGINDGVFGKSITDPCLGWEKTEDMLLRTADIL